MTAQPHQGAVGDARKRMAEQTPTDSEIGPQIAAHDLDPIATRLSNANSLALDESVARWYRTDVPALLAEVERLRATNTRLNRRATDAEGQVRTTIEDCRRQGRSLGRGLANVGYGIAIRERDEAIARAEAAEARAAALEATLAEVRALHTRDRERLAKVEAVASGAAYSGRHINGYPYVLVNALRAALATTSEEAER